MPPPGDTALTDDAARCLAEREAIVSVLEAVAGSVVTYDVATGKARVNAAAVALFGLDGSFANLPLDERLAVLQPRHEDGTPWRAEDTPLQRALRGETVREVVAQMRAADGRVLWICTSAVPVRLGGEITGVIQTLRDVTEQRRTEEARRRGEAELRAIFETSRDFMVIKDREGRMLRVNAATCELMGLPSDQIVGKGPYEIHRDPEIAAAISASDRRIMESGQAEVLEERGNYLNGPRLFTSTRAPYRDAEGTVVGILAISRDVTEQRRAEEALRASEARFRTLFEKAGEAVVITATEGPEAGTFLEVNAAAAAMFGFAREEMRGMHLTRVVPPDETPAVPALFADMTQRWISTERIRVRKDGTRFPLELVAGPLELEGKRCIVVFGHDVSERARYQQELLQARDAAEAASRAKSAFLANMSHEVRTPMHSILGYAQVLLRDPAIRGSHRQGLKAIFKSGEHLLALLNDLLDVSRIGSGLFAANRAPLDVKALIGEAVHLHAPRAAEKGLNLALDWSPGVPRVIVGDQEKLGRVLASLLSNAIKFTERGGATVAVAVRPAERDGGDERLVVSVRDTGTGIGAADLERLFRPFAQTRVGIEAHGGTGLGLALSRELARLMGGDLAAESRPGEGSTFRLDLPLERGEGADPASSHGAVTGVKGQRAPKRILIVEDDEDERILLRVILGHAGFDVREATDGAASLEAFDAWRPHLVLLDMSLPVLDGYAVARAVREREVDSATPLVALTARARPSERARMLEAGVDVVLVKPSTAGEILEAIRRQLGIEYTYEEQAAGIEPPSQPPSSPRASLVPSVPPSLLAELRDTVRAADYFRMMEIIDQLPDDTAGELRALAERYDYAAIEELLRV